MAPSGSIEPPLWRLAWQVDHDRALFPHPECRRRSRLPLVDRRGVAGDYVVVELSRERRPLGVFVKGLLGFGSVMALGLVIASVCAVVHARRVEREARRLEAERLRENLEKTRETLEEMTYIARDVPRLYKRTVGPRAPRGVACLVIRIGTDGGCMYALVGQERAAEFPTQGGHPEEIVRDRWGNPLLCRSPGPVHTRGWDLWSTGPNGVDEDGHGDDIIIGADVAAVSTRHYY